MGVLSLLLHAVLALWLSEPVFLRSDYNVLFCAAHAAVLPCQPSQTCSMLYSHAAQRHVFSLPGGWASLTHAAWVLGPVSASHLCYILSCDSSV